MKKILTAILLTIISFAFGQTEILPDYIQARRLLKKENYTEAYKILKEVETKCNPKDTLYEYILRDYIFATSKLEQYNRLSEQFETSLQFGLEAFELIKKGDKNFKKKSPSLEYWVSKNITVSYFGLEQFDKAKKYRDFLYKGYKEKKLPKGIDEYFNFDFFKIDDKNVWGYEWYHKLPKDRLSSSFTKIVYYVYSTNPDGSDKDQLYRLHVLMFHKDKNPQIGDYILEKQIETDRHIRSGPYIQYMYKEDIDYKKLRNDVKEVIKNKINPTIETILEK